jgi:hypothetical protein
MSITAFWDILASLTATVITGGGGVVIVVFGGGSISSI